MAMTYSDIQSSLEKNEWLKGRCRTATANFANYLMNTPEADPDYDAKVNSGMNLLRTIDTVMMTLMPSLAGDSELQAAGPAITDALLQTLVEKTINKFWPVGAAPAMLMTASVRAAPVFSTLSPTEQ